MSPPSKPAQFFYFYNGSFTSEMDKTLIRSLVCQKKEGKWEASQMPSEVIRVACLTVNHFHGTNLTFEDIVQRKGELHERYSTYRAIANFPGVQPDFANSIVYADEKTWAKLYRKFPLARAYRQAGEPEFTSLCELFGFNAVKEERSKIVINISSGTRTSGPGVGAQGVQDEEEVTSPIMKATCRKLFDDEEQSSTNVDQRFLFHPTRNTPRFPFRCPPNGRNTSGSDAGSSCASNSPNPHVWGPFK